MFNLFDKKIIPDRSRLDFFPLTKRQRDWTNISCYSKPRAVAEISPQFARHLAVVGNPIKA